jgi:hypothetical protein
LSHLNRIVFHVSRKYTEGVSKKESTRRGPSKLFTGEKRKRMEVE